MSCKVVKTENSIEGGNRSYFIVTFDFNSLEARLAAIDTVLNDTGLDPVLKNIYKDGEPGDLHSTTGYNTFFKNAPGIKVHDDVDNKDYVFHAKSVIKVRHDDGTEEIVSGANLKETDHIVEHMRA